MSSTRRRWRCSFRRSWAPEHDGLYYPSFSGVGRSLNYYPINDEQPEDGVAQVAVGLGKYIVDGGASLRFSPRHPAKVLQTSTLDLALRDTQTRMYALDLGQGDVAPFSIDDGFNPRPDQGAGCRPVGRSALYGVDL